MWLQSSFILLATFLPNSLGEGPVNCKWGNYADWSECDGCTKTQVRERKVEIFPQFDGSSCIGEALQRRDDCEDASDERLCSSRETVICDTQKTPPNSDLIGRGFDVLTGELRASVINTFSFGGQCRKAFSGDHREFYRLPQNLLRYSFQTYHLLILRNEVEVAQFQNNAPEYLPLSEDFWKDLATLPNTYEPSAYRLFIQRYGTHYMEEGSLGGQYQALLELDANYMMQMSRTETDFHQCVTRVKRRLFYKKSTTNCVKLMNMIESFSEKRSNKMPIKTDIIGGDGAFIASLGILDLENPDNNKLMYSKWAGSVKEFPKVIKQKLRPLYDLVKEVPCAGLKKLLLKRALEDYLVEQSPCRCKPCQNNGMPLLIEGTLFFYSRTMEPHCFDPSVTPLKTCQTPPPLINGFVLSPKDMYPVGSKAEYTCKDGYTHIGNPISECTENLTWRNSPMECKKIACDPPAVLSNVIAAPLKQTYLIGEGVSLSCPTGMEREGDAEIMCRFGLVWYPPPQSVLCKQVEAAPTQPSLLCKPWEKPGNGICVCRMPYECKGTLNVCASVRPGRVNTMSICQLGALQCLGRPFTLLPDSACTLPATTFTSCEDCHQWETCDGSQCKCKDPEECSDDSTHLCASLMGGAPEEMSECKVAAWRCQGKEITVLRVGGCQT
ncbi:hypothetical protein DNTS_034111 [Danionella cerebrum]|uniref:Complement component C7 n=1 Tax=Danionella cerebrum TaxID=2873325 RepID=A0A553R6P7_9TELE|nr:hypothetical protein DNTS_034111 [Danionella translucida]